MAAAAAVVVMAATAVVAFAPAASHTDRALVLKASMRLKHSPGVGFPGPAYGSPQKAQPTCRHWVQVLTGMAQDSGSDAASGGNTPGDLLAARLKDRASRNRLAQVPKPLMAMSLRRPMRSMRKKPIRTPAVAHMPMLMIACAMAPSLTTPAMPMISML